MIVNWLILDDKWERYMYSSPHVTMLQLEQVSIRISFSELKVGGPACFIDTSCHKSNNYTNAHLNDENNTNGTRHVLIKHIL